jgi:hypothetical protein
MHRDPIFYIVTFFLYRDHFFYLKHHKYQVTVVQYATLIVNQETWQPYCKARSHSG